MYFRFDIGQRKKCWSRNLRTCGVSALQFGTHNITFVNFPSFFFFHLESMADNSCLGGTNELIYAKAFCMRQSLYVHVKNCDHSPIENAKDSHF